MDLTGMPEGGELILAPGAPRSRHSASGVGHPWLGARVDARIKRADNRKRRKVLRGLTAEIIEKTTRPRSFCFLMILTQAGVAELADAPA